MDCQVWVYRTDTCCLYTCLYIWSTSDFPLDILFECLWGKHQGFLEWLGFLRFCLFLYLFYTNWKFCQTHSDCLENIFHSQKKVKKKGSCNSIKLGREKRGKLAPVSFESYEKPPANFPHSSVRSRYKVKSCRGRTEIHTASYSRMVISVTILTFHNANPSGFSVSLSQWKRSVGIQAL